MPTNSKNKLINSLCIAISALTVGLMWGMAISPTANVIIPSLTAALLSVSTLISGIDNSHNGEPSIPRPIRQLSSINMLPMAILTVGLAVGSSVGIYCRTHGVLGQSIESSKQITKSDTSAHKLESVPGLYATKSNICGELILKHGKKLEDALMVYGGSGTVRLVTACKHDSLGLETIKNLICK